MDQLEEMRQISRELWRKSQEDIAHKDDGAELNPYVLDSKGCGEAQFGRKGQKTSKIDNFGLKCQSLFPWTSR